MSRRPFHLFVAALAVPALLLSSCRGAAPRIASLPDVPADLAAALEDPSPEPLAAWVERAGASAVRRLLLTMNQALPADDDSHLQVALTRSGPAMRRLASETDRQFGVSLLPSVERWLGWSLETRARVPRLSEEIIATNRREATAPEREREIRACLEEARERLFFEGELSAYNRLANFWADEGDSEQALRAYREGLARAREVREVWWELQFLGVAGHYHEEAHEFDRMREDWAAGIALADRCRIDDQAARLHLFLANHEIQSGRYVAARMHLDEAEAHVRGPSGCGMEARVVQRRLEWQADFECWDVVDLLLRRQDAVLAALPTGDTQADQLFRSRRDRVAARRESARGNFVEADRLWARADSLLGSRVDRQDRARLLLERGRALLDDGQDEMARTRLEDAVEWARANDLEHTTIHALALLGCACAATGRGEAARIHLREFEELAGQVPGEFSADWARSDAALVRVAGDDGDAAEARHALETGVDRARRILRHVEPSGAAYLLANQLDRVFDAGDELLAEEPRTSLALEMERRRLRAEIGRDLSDDGESPAAADVPSLQEALARRDATLLVWRVRSDRLIAWLVTPHDVRREIVTEDVAAVRRIVEQLITNVSGVIAGDALAARASDALIPRAFRSSLFDAGQILFAPDGFLCCAPVELLPDRDGRPLFERHDVAALRADAPHAAPTRGAPPVIVGAPAMSPATTRRWPALGKLRGAVDEAHDVAALLPGVILLEGARATKENVERVWSNAEVLHISAHFVRDPLMPLMTFVPLADPNAIANGESALEISDVRAAAFDATKLVVLAGCSSGPPWSGAVAAPGLGEAFLDSGAQAVVETRWEIDDAIAHALVTQFMQLRAEGEEPVRALNAVRRTANREGVSPFDWAAYSIVLGRL
ncbi:MAG: CHAT domain-containing protein [bacterium]